MKTDLSNTFKNNDEIVSDPETIANKFNEYFVNVGVSLANKIPENSGEFCSYLNRSNVNSIFLNPVTESEVHKEILK